MKSNGQVELAEEVSVRNEHGAMITRTVGFVNLLDIAFMSRGNRDCEFFPIGSTTVAAASLPMR
jgi:hypothetical protein